MRRREREITDRGEMEDILRRATVLHLGFVEAGRAYVVPVDFAYSEGTLYFHSAREGRKIDLLKQDPFLTFEVMVDHEVIPGDVGCQWTSRYRSVMGQGTAHFTEDPDEKIGCLDVLLGKYAEGPFVYDSNVLARTAVLRIEIDSMTGKKSGY